MRYRTYLRQRYRAFIAYMGVMLMIIGGLYLLPLGVIPFYPEESAHASGFLGISLPLIVSGYLLQRQFYPDEPLSLSITEGMMIVLVMWVIAVGAGGVPFMLSGDLTFTQAMFESTSGWTTTGLSVVDVTEASRILLFYRSLLQMAGGAGFAILMLSTITGPAGVGLSVAEGRGDQLVPHVRRSAELVLRIYVAYIAVGTVALWLAGMSAFDAINHAFTAVATGGFSTRPESIGYWNSGVIETIIIVLMLLGSLNFLTAFTLLQGKFRPVLRNGEVRLVAVVLPIASLLLLWGITTNVYPDAGKAVRAAIFEATSALTGTGFSTVSNFHIWDDFGWLLLIVLMTIGGGSGSTAGGFKQFRVYVLVRALIWEVRRAFLPKHVVRQPEIWQGESRGFLSNLMVRQVVLVVFFYVVVLLTGTAIITLHGFPLDESLFEFASALGTVGLSVGVTSAEAEASLLWTKIFGMIMGRLEFFTVIIGILKLAGDIPVLLGHIHESRPKNR
jgi:trk system potassium uptake protein